MKHFITIPNWRPARDNQLVGANRYAAGQLKRSDAKMVGSYANFANIPKAEGRRRVQLQITLKGAQKQTDPMAYAKSCLDALVKCGLLVDDTDRYVEWVPPSYNRIGEARTVIVLEDIA